MTNNEAIGILAIVVETAKGRCFVTDEAISDAYAMAISALQAQEAKNSKESSSTHKALDTISRQAAIDAVSEGCFELRGIFKECEEKLLALPSAQPDRKTGWWLIREGISDVQCSECGMYFRDVYDMENSDAFCRHCGTKMEGLKVVEDE